MSLKPVPLPKDLVGDATPLTAKTWDERDVMLYALGVGAGQDTPDQDLALTTENSAGVSLKVLPSFLCVLAVSPGPPALHNLDKAPFLHAEEEVTLNRPLPVNGPGYVRSRIEAVYDKGKHALIAVRAELFADAAGRDLIGSVVHTSFVRGGGGFGGERGSAPPWSVPDRAADHRRHYRTRSEQGLIYRLSGDRHPLHSDPTFARENGFERPILHGLCTFGFACRGLVNVLCAGDVTRLHTMRGRFSHPVYPGDALTIEIWRGDAGRVTFRVLRNDAEVVIDRGEAAVR